MPAIPSFHKSLFLEGRPSTGKTTAAIDYVSELIKEGVTPESILILVPRSAVGVRYGQSLSVSDSDLQPYITTFNDFVQSTLEAFWSQLDEASDKPVFLNNELTRYYLSRFIAPYATSGVFQSVRLSKSRLIGQIFDHYQQAAANGISLEE